MLKSINSLRVTIGKCGHWGHITLDSGCGNHDIICVWYWLVLCTFYFRVQFVFVKLWNTVFHNKLLIIDFPKSIPPTLFLLFKDFVPRAQLVDCRVGSPPNTKLPVYILWLLGCNLSAGWTWYHVSKWVVNNQGGTLKGTHFDYTRYIVKHMVYTVACWHGVQMDGFWRWRWESVTYTPETPIYEWGVNSEI